jgi:hypothetical protein
MRHLPLLLYLSFISYSLSQAQIQDTKLAAFNEGKTNKITFTENKGQVSDQHFAPRLDVLFSGEAGGLVYHLRNDGISYQTYKVDSWKEEESDVNNNEDPKMVPDQMTIYRTDINWIGTNKNFTIEKGTAHEDYNNYYLAVCPDGVTHVKSYESVVYKNIYNGIDLKWYDHKGELEYDFVVAPGVDTKKSSGI